MTTTLPGNSAATISMNSTRSSPVRRGPQSAARRPVLVSNAASKTLEPCREYSRSRSARRLSPSA